MKKTILLLSFMVPPLCAVANPAFYVIHIQDDRQAILHTTDQALARERTLPFAQLDGKQSQCCFVFTHGARNKRAPNGEDDPAPLMTENDEPTYQFAGKYRPVAAAKDVGGLAFGIRGMRDARSVGNDTYKVSFPAAAPLFVRQCFSTEGLHFKLYRTMHAKKPFASYYYYLGYDLEANCPGMRAAQ